MANLDATPQTATTNALSALPFQTLIGGPLEAAISAQPLAAKTTWEFIKEVGLWDDPKTGEKKAVNVTFMFQKDGEMPPAARSRYPLPPVRLLHPDAYPGPLVLIELPLRLLRAGSHDGPGGEPRLAQRAPAAAHRHGQRRGRQERARSP